MKVELRSKEMTRASPDEDRIKTGGNKCLSKLDEGIGATRMVSDALQPEAESTFQMLTVAM